MRLCGVAPLKVRRARAGEGGLKSTDEKGDVTGAHTGPPDIRENSRAIKCQGLLLSPEGTQYRRPGANYSSESCALKGRESCCVTGEESSLTTAATCLVPLVKAEGRLCQESRKPQKGPGWSHRSCSTRRLVAKTREAFLLQMAVDIRRAEILKLHDKAAQKAESLRRAESFLSRDAQKFDEFLRSSDAAAHEAICKADNAARVAQEKAVAVRSLRQKLDAAQARTALNREKEWLEEHEEQFRENLQQKKVQWVRQQMQQQQQQYAAELEAIQDELRDKLQELEKKKNSPGKATRRELEEKAEKRRRQLIKRLKTASDIEESFDGEKMAVTEMQLYFQDPEEPLRLFKELEEENLLLIQNAYRNVTELEAMEKRFAETRVEMQARLEGLEALIAQLQAQLVEQQEAEMQEEESDSSTALEKLTLHIVAIHTACGLEREGSLDCLRMLEQIEGRLDSHLASLAKHEAENPKLVRQLEKVKEQQRRERTRQEKLSQQYLKNDERLQVNSKAEGEWQAAIDYELYFQ
ncbi:hypothetical protein Efla_001103 [Eimeria flavescens]